MGMSLVGYRYGCRTTHCRRIIQFRVQYGHTEHKEQASMGTSGTSTFLAEVGLGVNMGQPS